MDVLLEVEKLSITLGNSTSPPPISFALNKGDTLAIHGSNASGKSLILGALIGGVEATGSIKLLGIEYADDEIYKSRKVLAEYMAYAPQRSDLLPHLSLEKNLELAITIAAEDKGGAKSNLPEALRVFGLGSLRKVKIDRFSASEIRRSLILRALLLGKQILVLDEPNESLDDQSVAEIFELIIDAQLVAEFALIMATHSSGLAYRCRHRIELGV